MQIVSLQCHVVVDLTLLLLRYVPVVALETVLSSIRFAETSFVSFILDETMNTVMMHGVRIYTWQ